MSVTLSHPETRRRRLPHSGFVPVGLRPYSCPLARPTHPLPQEKLQRNTALNRTTSQAGHWVCYKRNFTREIRLLQSSSLLSLEHRRQTLCNTLLLQNV